MYSRLFQNNFTKPATVLYYGLTGQLIYLSIYGLTGQYMGFYLMQKESTKVKILSAARTLFVANGFSGTSIGNIAKLAAVNHSLVFHHFKNKEQLWIAVKQNIVYEINQHTAPLPECNLSFDIFLKELFLRNLRFYRKNPDLIRIINWQRLEHDSNHEIGVTNSGDMMRWIQAFRHYQSQGDIQSNFKPEWIVTMVLSIISSAALDPNVFINDKQAINAYIDFCIETLLRGFK